MGLINAICRWRRGNHVVCDRLWLRGGTRACSLFDRSDFSLLPTAAKRLVEVDDRNQLVAFRLGQRVFSREEQLLGFKNLEIAGAPGIVTHQRQLRGVTKGSDLRLKRQPLRRQRSL